MAGGQRGLEGVSVGYRVNRVRIHYSSLLAGRLVGRDQAGRLGAGRHLRPVSQDQLPLLPVHIDTQVAPPSAMSQL